MSSELTIPEGWDKATLQSVSDPSASIRYGVVQIGPDTPNGVPIIAIKYLDNIAKAPLHRASHDIEKKYKNSRVRGGDVLISVKGTIGEVGVVPEGFEGNIAREIARIRPSAKVRADYLALQLQASHTQNRIDRLTVGTTRREFSISTVKSFEFPLPHIREQHRIAEILAIWGCAIKTVEALVTNAKRKKKALLQQLLPRGTQMPAKRLPGFSGEWKVKRLDQVCKITKGKQKNRDGLSEDGPVPVINGGIDASGYTTDANTEANTITISEGGNSCGFVNLIDVPFWCGGHCYALLTLHVDQDYLFGFLKHHEKQIMRLRVGSGLPNIQKKDVAAFFIAIPHVEEQKAIGNIARTMDAEITAYQSQHYALTREKAALMQQLLTGKRRVRVDEEQAETIA